MNRRLISKPTLIAAFALLLVCVPLIYKDIYWISVFILVGIKILMTASLRVIGLIGHFSLGHIGFMLVGAYTSALLVIKAGIPFGVALVTAGGVSGALALVLGYPFLRVKGIYFAILTLLTAESFRLLAFSWRSLTGGPFGLMAIPAPGPLNVPLIGTVNFESAYGYYYLVLAIVGGSLLVLYRLEHSRLGFTWRAIREQDRLAGAVGINALLYKIINFSVGCFFAGVSGALFAHFQRGLSADASSTFGVLTSIYLLIYLVVGGENDFIGPIIGSAALLLIMEFTRPLQQYQPMMIGAIAIGVVLLLPGGLVTIPGQLLKLSKLKRHRRTPVENPSSAAGDDSNGPA